MRTAFLQSGEEGNEMNEKMTLFRLRDQQHGEALIESFVCLRGYIDQHQSPEGIRDSK